MNDPSDVDFKARTPEPTLGPALWLFGTTLWAYVVAGQLVVSQDFPEPVAVLGVLFAVGVSWFFAIEQSFLVEEPSRETRLQRIFLPLGMALGLWLATLLMSAVIGLTSRDDIDSAITLSLWLLSLVPFFVGRRISKGTSRSVQDGARRALGILLWIGAAFVTLIALLPIIK